MADLNLSVEISREEAIAKKCRHAAHCMIYTKENFHNESLVMMQLRFDGSFGFVGGLVDRDETWEQALNRELHEEIGFDSKHHPIKPENYVFSAYFKADNLCAHFYVLELTHTEYKTCERGVFEAQHFGTETMGIVRVPLFTIRHSHGFPMFLCNRFVGNARAQLTRGLKIAKILTDDQLSKAIMEADKIPR